MIISSEFADMPDDEPIREVDINTPFMKLGKDLRAAAHSMGRNDARFLVDYYYTAQDRRIRAAGQHRASEKAGKPHALINWLFKTDTLFENAIKAALGEFAACWRVGQWLQAQYGIGPVLSAAMLANFDISRAKTVGHFWRFAGLDPSCVWLGKAKSEALLAKVVGKSKDLTQDMAVAIQKASGQHPTTLMQVFYEGTATKAGRKTGVAALKAKLSRCPYNQELKSLVCYKLGETMVKFSTAEDKDGNWKCYYGRLFADEKERLIKANAAGAFATAAAAEIERCRAEGHLAKMEDKARMDFWKNGQLCPQHIHERARRYMVKLFLSHVHQVMYEDYYGTAAPVPYIFEHPNGVDHRHLLVPPFWGESYKYSGKRLTELC